MVTTEFPPVVGGLQTYALELARRFAESCEHFTVVAPFARGCHAYDKELPFQIRRLPQLGDDLAVSGVLPLMLILRRGRFDVAFATHWAAAHAVLRAGGAGHLERVYTAAHGKELLLRPLERVPSAQRTYDRVRRLVLDRATGFFPVASHTASLLEDSGVDPARIVTVPSGVDADRFRPQDVVELRRGLGAEGRRVLLTVARLVRRKGIDTVLEALPEVADRIPDVLYLVAGDGPDRGRLERVAYQLGVAGRVRFLGQVPGDVARYHNACDLFVMPTRTEPEGAEGFGLVFLEAGACEKPVVGARGGGAVDAIVHEETGLLVPPNDPPALARALVRVLDDPELARRMGRAGREHVLRHGTWDHAAQRILAAMG